MNLADATNFDRKSGLRSGGPCGAPFPHATAHKTLPLLRSRAPYNLDEVVQPQVAGKGFLDLISS